MANASSSYLDVVDGFFGEAVTPEHADLLDDLPEEQLADLEIAFKEFDAAWAPPDDAIHTSAVFQCSQLMGMGLPYATMSQAKYRWGMTWDISYLAKLLLYMPRVAVCMPAFTDFEWRLPGDVRHLMAVKPFIDSGAVVPIPASYVSRVTGWDDSTRTSQAIRFAEKDLERPEIGRALESFRPFDDEGSISDSRYVFELAHNFHHITRLQPLQTLNEDLLVAEAAGADLVCPNQAMFDLMRAKIDQTTKLSLPEVWSQQVYALPDIRELPVSEVARIRGDEESLAEWRSSVERALRVIRNEVEAGREIVGSDTAKIIDGELMEGSMRLRDRVKTKSLANHFETAGVSFGIGAAAAMIFSSTPLVAVGTGAFNAALKFVYDVVRRGPNDKDLALAQLYTLFHVAK